MKEQPPIICVVGLGNPGVEYAQTRHNVGFMLVEQLAQSMGATWSMECGFFGAIAKVRRACGTLFFIKPLTYMNRSGQAVGAVSKFYKIDPAQILVCHDELDIPNGQVKLKFGGGNAGHNGLKDISRALGTSDYWRLRLGIDHPRELGLNQGVADYVLHRPSNEQCVQLSHAINCAEQTMPRLYAGEYKSAQQQLRELLKVS